MLGGAQGEFKPGQTVEYAEESRQMRWWLHDRVNYGYTEAGFKALQNDAARVRSAQAAKEGAK